MTIHFHREIIKKILVISFNFFCSINVIAQTQNLPNGFVYLKNIDPSIQQDIRYFSYHNFIGRPIKGYIAAECILTMPAAQQLAQVQQALQPYHLSLKVYDCYRPQMAVNDFINWSERSDQQQMKAEFYPRINKKDFFKLGYAATKSGHSRGSTVDLTIVPVPTPAQESYQQNQKLIACFAAYGKRFRDNSIDMGTGFDCMDPLAHALTQAVSKTAEQNRLFLRNLMVKYGFVPYDSEWWHFTLKNEPYPNTYFNFPVAN